MQIFNFHNRKGQVQRGFSLIELLVVIGIMGILSTIVINAVGVSRIAARDAVRYSDIRQINNAIQYYVDQYGTPPDFDRVIASDNESDWAELAEQLSPYITPLPRDPCGAACPILATNPDLEFVYFYIPPSVMRPAYDSLCDVNPGSACSVDPRQIYRIYAQTMEKFDPANEETLQKFGFYNFGESLDEPELVTP